MKQTTSVHSWASSCNILPSCQLLYKNTCTGNKPSKYHHQQGEQNSKAPIFHLSFTLLWWNLPNCQCSPTAVSMVVWLNVITLNYNWMTSNSKTDGRGECIGRLYAESHKEENLICCFLLSLSSVLHCWHNSLMSHEPSRQNLFCDINNWEVARSAIFLEPNSHQHGPKLKQWLVDVGSL